MCKGVPAVAAPTIESARLATGKQGDGIQANGEATRSESLGKLDIVFDRFEESELGRIEPVVHYCGLEQGTRRRRGKLEIRRVECLAG